MENPFSKPPQIVHTERVPEESIVRTRDFEKHRQEDNLLAQDILLQREETPGEVWKPVFEQCNAEIEKYIQPLGHGTSSDHLESILLEGLGAKKPDESFSPALNSMCDLHIPDGFLGSYAFATWNDLSNLVVNAERITRRDIIDRYAEQNPHIDNWLKKILLRKIAKQYSEKRGRRNGYPVLLIYDGQGQANVNYRGKNIPSEVDCKSILPSNLLQYIFAPAENVQQVYSFWRAWEYLVGYCLLSYSNCMR
jgi:hypothetical protein